MDTAYCIDLLIKDLCDIRVLSISNVWDLLICIWTVKNVTKTDSTMWFELTLGDQDILHHSKNKGPVPQTPVFLQSWNLVSTNQPPLSQNHPFQGSLNDGWIIGLSPVHSWSTWSDTASQIPNRLRFRIARQNSRFLQNGREKVKWIKNRYLERKQIS